MKRSFFEFWTSRKEKEDYVKKSNQLKLSPSQLTRLLGDSGVRDALVNSRLAPLLPPAGTDVFRPFTPASLEKIEHQHTSQEKRRKINEAEEEHLLKPTPELAAEKTLPFFYGDPPPELLNTPLEDLDPYYQSKKTFIVLSKGNIISRFDAGSACLQLSPFSLLRRLAIKTLNHPYPLRCPLLSCPPPPQKIEGWLRIRWLDVIYYEFSGLQQGVAWWCRYDGPGFEPRTGYLGSLCESFACSPMSAGVL